MMDRYSIEITTDDNVFNLEDNLLKNCDCDIEIVKDSSGLYVKYEDVKDLLESKIQIIRKNE